METKFTAVAMRCNQEQFEAIKPKFKNTKWKVLSDIMVNFEVDAYLVNNYKKNKIVNIHETCKAYHNRTVYETWNEATFLRACGIEAAEPLTVSKEFILEAHNSACSTWKRKLEEKFPSVFVKDELEVWKWYKNGDAGYSNSIACVFEVSKEDKDAFSGYGFERNGKWAEDYDFGWASYNWIPATPKEVETALIAEAKKRGFEEGVNIVDLYNGKSKNDYVLISSDDFEYEKVPCGKLQGKMALRDSDGSILFVDGKWATIIEQPTEMTVAEIEAKLGCKIKIVG